MGRSKTTGTKNGDMKKGNRKQRSVIAEREKKMIPEFAEGSKEEGK